MHAGYGDEAPGVALEPVEEPVYVAARVRRGAEFGPGEQRGLGDVRRDNVRARAQPPEGLRHAVVEAGVVYAVVGHGGVADYERVRPGEGADDLLEHELLLRRGEIARVYAVELYPAVRPVPSYGQHLVREVAARPAGELARVRAQERRGYAGALHPRRRHHRQGHRQRALPEAGYVVHGADSLKFWQSVSHSRYCSTLSPAAQVAAESPAGLAAGLGVLGLILLSR